MDITINLPTQTLTRTIPDSWNDCTPQQAMTLLQLLQLDGPNLMAKRLSALAYLLQLTDAEHQEWKMAYAIEHREDWSAVMAADLDAMLDSIGWLLKETKKSIEARKLDPDLPPKYELNASLTQNPLPTLTLQAAPSFHKYRSQRTKAPTTVSLYPPADELKNVSGEELAHLFTQYEKYTADPTSANCDRLIAILFRKSKLETAEQLENNWHGDRRQPFNEFNLDARAQLIGSQLHPMAKNLLLFWFLSCRMAIIEAWPVVFKKASEVREDKPDFSWWGVYMAIIDNPLRIDEFAKKPYGDLFTTIAWYDNKAKEEELRQALASV